MLKLHQDEYRSSDRDTSLGHLLNLDLSNLATPPPMNDRDEMENNTWVQREEEPVHTVERVSSPRLESALSPALSGLWKNLEEEEQKAQDLENEISERQKMEEEEVRVYLMELDEVRSRCVEHRLYQKAQACLDKMREVVVIYGRKLSKEADALGNGVEPRVRRYANLETRSLREHWKEQIIRFDEESKAAQDRFKEELRDVFAEQVDELNRRHQGGNFHYSKHILELERELRICIETGKYSEADRIQRRISKEKTKEEENFKTAEHRKLESNVAALNKRCEKEYTLFEDRIQRERQSMLKARDDAIATLRKRQESILVRLLRLVSSVRQKAKSSIETQIKAYLANPIQHGGCLVGLADILAGAQETVTISEKKLIPSIVHFSAS